MFDILGWIGAIFYILGYGLVATHKIAGDKKLFHFFNIIGAIGLTFAAWHNHDTPSLWLNIAWGIIAAFGMVTAVK
jgi:hypothetical protein